LLTVQVVNLPFT